jgi:flagellar biogenesis protein FliO
MQPGQVIAYFIGIILIIVAAYYFTYYIGKKSQMSNRQKGRNIALLERFAISKDKSFCIVEIAGKVYIVGVTNQSITLLDTLDAADFSGSAAAHSGEAAPGSIQSLYKGSGRSTLQDNLTGRLAAFLMTRMGKNPGDNRPGDNKPGDNKTDGKNAGDNKPGDNKPAGFNAFSDSMDKARNSVSGQPDQVSGERPDSPEGDE